MKLLSTVYDADAIPRVRDSITFYDQSIENIQGVKGVKISAIVLGVNIDYTLNEITVSTDVS